MTAHNSNFILYWEAYRQYWKYRIAAQRKVMCVKIVKRLGANSKCENLDVNRSAGKFRVY